MDNSKIVVNIYYLSFFDVPLIIEERRIKMKEIFNFFERAYASLEGATKAVEEAEKCLKKTEVVEVVDNKKVEVDDYIAHLKIGERCISVGLRKIEEDVIEACFGAEITPRYVGDSKEPINVAVLVIKNNSGIEFKLSFNAEVELIMKKL